MEEYFSYRLVKKLNMEIRDLRKQTISGLSLIILNDKNSTIIRNCAEIELKRRIKNLGWKFDDLLHMDDKTIATRGLDINSYLIGPDPTIQQLMEIYFNYYYEKKVSESQLLFSERHICTDLTFLSPFFNNIRNIEITNLNKRIKRCDNESEKEYLRTFKFALEQKKNEMNKVKEKYYQGIELLEFNEALQCLGQEDLLEFGKNLTEEEIYKIGLSPIRMLKYDIMVSLNDSVFDADAIDTLYGLKKIIEESKRLSTQKQKLHNEALTKIVDYRSEPMKKAYQKVKRSVYGINE